ncbi:hypothetical protein AB5I41_21550 [Sphingomonas sp. MMS24-JH45]
MVLMMAATGAVVVLAARAGLGRASRHDRRDAWAGRHRRAGGAAVQRRLARDAVMGAVIGAFPALALVGLLGAQASGLGSALLGSVSLGGGGWVVLTLLPFGFVALAAYVARRTIVAALARTL